MNERGMSKRLSFRALGEDAEFRTTKRLEKAGFSHFGRFCNDVREEI